MHYQYIHRALAVLALLRLAACAEADLSGSSATQGRVRDMAETTTETSTATSTTTSHAATKDAKEPSSQMQRNDRSDSHEVFDTDSLAALHSVDISAQTIAAPKVKLSKLEHFNQALYLSLECENAADDVGNCVSDDQNYGLKDLQVFLAIADAAKPEETAFSKTELQALNNLLSPSINQSNFSHIDYGPIALPGRRPDQILAIIVRYLPTDLGPDFASYKVFLADTWEDTP